MKKKLGLKVNQKTQEKTLVLGVRYKKNKILEELTKTEEEVELGIIL